jgi:hypothetical protein
MKTRKVVSREYKLMLQAAKFAGPDQHLLAVAGELWGELVGAIAPYVVRADGALDTISKQRLISFLDSKARHLWAGGYVLRLRRTLEGSRPEVTVKFRHPDRYVAASRQMKSRRIRATVKFEEDIKPPFVSLYGFSTCGRVGRKNVPDTVAAAYAFFPDLPKRVGKTDGDLKLRAVNGFTAREIVITGPILTIGTKPRVEIECALIVWYDHQKNTNAPVAVEFSFRYGSTSGRYSGKVARRAYNIFEALQHSLTEWLDPNSSTKTALVFGCTVTPDAKRSQG